MEYKTCPSCGEEAPAQAPRCKHCFHDFSTPVKKSSSGLVGLLAVFALMAAIGAGVFWYAGARQAQEYIVIDEETKSIIFTVQYADRKETDRLMFDQITDVELVKGGSAGTWEVAVHTLEGKRRTVRVSNDTDLSSYANKVASLVGKPLISQDSAAGLGGSLGEPINTMGTPYGTAPKSPTSGAPAPQ